MTLSSFAVTAGSVTGRDHLRVRRDGQDGFATVANDEVTAAIVTDGCSSGRASEVGARLGAVWLAELCARGFVGQAPDTFARSVTGALIERLRHVVCSFADDKSVDPRVVGDMFLFGFIAAVVTHEHAIVFGVGDGVVWVDGRTTVIDPGPDNAPTYAAYALLGAEIAPNILHLGRADDVESIAVATDGAAELLARGSTSSFEEVVGERRLFENPSLLRKRLLVLSDRGQLWDDATIGIVRRSA
jgi:hypothetical protein